MKNLLLLLPLACLAGCSPIYYAPPSHNVPLLQEQGEGTFSAVGGSHRGELQGAYAVSDHVGIMLNGMYSQPDNDSSGNGGSGYGIEGGAGYFMPVAENFVFETYGLLSFGGVENHFPSAVAGHPGTTGTIQANMFKIGVQPSFGFKSRFFDAAFSLRLASLNYSGISGSLIYGEEDQVQYLRQEKSQFLAEPAVTLRAGYQFIKLQLQYCYSANLTNPDFRQEKDALTFGLTFLIDK